MTTTGFLLFDILVWLNIYGIYVAIAFVPSCYYIWLRIFSFPLITRKSHELILMISPEKIIIKKIVSRELPFFKFRKGLYWFSEPFEDTESSNKFHIFVQGINQELSDIERRDNKLDEIISYTENIKSLSSHKILLPKNIKGHMHRHYMITLEPNGNFFKLTPTKQRQSHRYSFMHTVGIQIQNTIETEDQEFEDKENEIQVNQSSSNQQVIFTQLTTSTILQKIKYIQSYHNFSSFYAYKLSRKIKRINSNFFLWLMGSIDPRLIIVLISVFGAIALVYFGMPLLTPKLGPMPS